MSRKSSYLQYVKIDIPWISLLASSSATAFYKYMELPRRIDLRHPSLVQVRGSQCHACRLVIWNVGCELQPALQSYHAIYLHVEERNSIFLEQCPEIPLTPSSHQASPWVDPLQGPADGEYRIYPQPRTHLDHGVRFRDQYHFFDRNSEHNKRTKG